VCGLSRRRASLPHLARTRRGNSRRSPPRLPTYGYSPNPFPAAEGAGPISYGLAADDEKLMTIAQDAALRQIWAGSQRLSGA